MEVSTRTKQQRAQEIKSNQKEEPEEARLEDEEDEEERRILPCARRTRRVVQQVVMQPVQVERVAETCVEWFYSIRTDYVS